MGLDTLQSLGVVLLSLGVQLEDFVAVALALVVGVARRPARGRAGLNSLGKLLEGNRRCIPLSREGSREPRRRVRDGLFWTRSGSDSRALALHGKQQRAQAQTRDERGGLSH